MARRKRLITKKNRNRIFYFLGIIFLILGILIFILSIFEQILCLVSLFKPSFLYNETFFDNIFDKYLFYPFVFLLLLELFLIIIWRNDLEYDPDPRVYNFDFDDYNYFFDKIIEYINDKYSNKHEFILDGKYKVKYYSEKKGFLGLDEFHHTYAFVYIPEPTSIQMRKITRESWNFLNTLNISRGTQLFLTIIVCGDKKQRKIKNLHYYEDELILYISKQDKELYMMGGIHWANRYFKKLYKKINGKKLIRKKVSKDYFKK